MFASIFPYFHKQYQWGVICSLLFLQLWIGMMSPVAMMQKACPAMDMTVPMQGMSHHEASSACQQYQHQHNISCQQLCACVNGLIGHQVLPVIAANYAYSFIIYHLFSGISFSPPLPPPK